MCSASDSTTAGKLSGVRLNQSAGSRGRACTVALVVAGASLALAAAAIAGNALSLAVAKRTVTAKSETIVIDGRGVTVYELGGESLAKLECVTRACFNIWPPVKVPSAATHVQAGPGVPGTVSIMHRVKGGFYEVMLDRHPLYYYSGDHGRKGRTGGQGMTSFGGTWHVVKSG
jgi:predicted lipoprotein with Yx(FWY)xxD motif